MASLKVTFGRALTNVPIMMGRDRRTELIEIGASAASGNMICDPTDNNHENAADLQAEAACWVEIGASPEANAPGTDPDTNSFYMAAGERLQCAIVKGDRVSVVTA